MYITVENEAERIDDFAGGDLILGPPIDRMPPPPRDLIPPGAVILPEPGEEIEMPTPGKPDKRRLDPEFPGDHVWDPGKKKGDSMAQGNDVPPWAGGIQYFGCIPGESKTELEELTCSGERFCSYQVRCYSHFICREKFRVQVGGKAGYEGKISVLIHSDYELEYSDCEPSCMGTLTPSLDKVFK